MQHEIYNVESPPMPISSEEFTIIHISVLNKFETDLTWVAKFFLSDHKSQYTLHHAQAILIWFIPWFDDSQFWVCNNLSEERRLCGFFA